MGCWTTFCIRCPQLRGVTEDDQGPYEARDEGGEVRDVRGDGGGQGQTRKDYCEGRLCGGIAKKHQADVGNFMCDTDLDDDCKVNEVEEMGSKLKRKLRWRERFICWHCGGRGRFADGCLERKEKKEQRGRDEVVCWRCAKRGHFSDECKVGEDELPPWKRSEPWEYEARMRAGLRGASNMGSACSVGRVRSWVEFAKLGEACEA